MKTKSYIMNTTALLLTGLLYLAICSMPFGNVLSRYALGLMPLALYALFWGRSEGLQWVHGASVFTKKKLWTCLGAITTWSIAAISYPPMSLYLPGFIAGLGLLLAFAYGTQAKDCSTEDDKNVWQLTRAVNILGVALWFVAALISTGGPLSASDTLYMLYALSPSVAMYLPIAALRLVIAVHVWRFIENRGWYRNKFGSMLTAAFLFGLLHLPYGLLTIGSMFTIFLGIMLYSRLRRWGPILISLTLADMVLLMGMKITPITLVWGSIWAQPPTR